MPYFPLCGCREVVGTPEAALGSALAAAVHPSASSLLRCDPALWELAAAAYGQCCTTGRAGQTVRGPLSGENVKQVRPTRRRPAFYCHCARPLLNQISNETLPLPLVRPNGPPERSLGTVTPGEQLAGPGTGSRDDLGSKPFMTTVAAAVWAQCGGVGERRCRQPR